MRRPMPRRSCGDAGRNRKDAGGERDSGRAASNEVAWPAPLAVRRAPDGPSLGVDALHHRRETAAKQRDRKTRFRIRASVALLEEAGSDLDHGDGIGALGSTVFWFDQNRREGRRVEGRKGFGKGSTKVPREVYQNGTRGTDECDDQPEESLPSRRYLI